MADFGPMPIHTFTYPARLSREVDGDSMWMVLDKGFKDTAEHELRLAGLNCPERGTPEGNAATVFTSDWLWKGVSPPMQGWPFLVVSQKTEKYGRYLSTVYRVSDGACLNADLLTAGHAVVYNP